MGDASREPYEAEAAHEQGLRDQARLEPFACKSDLKTGNADHASELASAGLRKNSLRHVAESRTIQSYKQFCDQSQSMFKCWNAGIADADGCLRLDHVNLDMDRKDLEAKWSHALHSPVEELPEVTGTDCHHQVCHELHSCCVKSPHVKLASQYVQAMNRALTEGSLAFFEPHAFLFMFLDRPQKVRGH